MNSKLRSDSVFTQLTNEQIEMLEEWLFEEKLSYKEVIEKIQKEFGVKTSQTALGRYFRRLAEGRAQEWRVETIAQCLEALATAKGDGTLQAGLFTMANMHAVRLMTEEKPSFRQLTGWLRAMTSAGAFEMKRVEIYESKEKERLAEIERKEKEVKKREEDAIWSAQNRAYWDARDAKRKATLAAKKAEKEAKARAEAGKVEVVASESNMVKEATSPPEAARVTDGRAGTMEASAVIAATEPPEGGTSNVGSERRLAAGLAAAECPDNPEAPSTSPAPEATLSVISEVPPTEVPVTKNSGCITRDENADFTINWGDQKPHKTA